MGTRQDDALAPDALAPDALASLFEGTALPVIAVDHQRRAILRANRAALTMLGLDASVIVGRPATELLTEPSAEQQHHIRALLGEETAAIREVATPGGVRTVELNIVPARSEGIALLELHDLTPLLEVAGRAEAAQDELQRTTTALRTVAARLAHDVRGPMTAISGFADLLRDGAPPLDEAQRTRLLERISANTRALATMTDAILGEADSGALRPEDSSRAVEDLFRAVRGVTDAQMSTAGGELRTTAQVAELPVAVGRVRQAVINLVSNSIKYRHPSRQLVVELDVRATDAGTLIVVCDNGQGLPADTAALFEAGTRGPAAEGTIGAGLGLAFARAAVESVKGHISARPLTEGAEVEILLPHLDDDVETAAAEPGETGPALTGPQLARVVDSSPVATFVIDIALRQIVCVNRTSVELLGFDEADILGRPGADFVDEQEIAEGLRRRVMTHPHARHPVRTRLRTVDGDQPALVWVTLVEGTALAVAQVVLLSEVEALDSGSPELA